MTCEFYEGGGGIRTPFQSPFDVDWLHLVGTPRQHAPVVAARHDLTSLGGEKGCVDGSAMLAEFGEELERLCGIVGIAAAKQWLVHPVRQ